MTTQKVNSNQAALHEWFDEWDLPEGTTEWKIDEAADKDSSVVDGANILARVVGPMFLVDGASRNKRFYSKKLWEKAISDSAARMESGLMLGTIGHEHPLDDTALLNGMASHRVSKLWIDEGRKIGMGEILVLNTVAGRNLNGYLRGGAAFPVSSRAFGEFTGKKVDGNDEIDENSYTLQTFDFVQVPGVSQAVPQLVEHNVDSQSEKLKPNQNEDTTGDANMSDRDESTQKILENLSTDKIQLQGDLDQALAANKKLESEKTIEAHKAEVAASKAEELEKAHAEVTAKLADAEAAVAKYESAGEAEAVTAKLAAHDELTKKLEALGTVEDIEAVMAKASEFIKEHGTFEDVAAKIIQADKYEELGTSDEVAQALDVLEQYIELGTIEDIKEVFKAAMDMADKTAKDEEESTVDQFVADTGVDKTVAESLLSKMDVKEAEGIVEGLAKQGKAEGINARYKKDEAVGAGAKDESQEDKGEATNSRALSFFENSTRG